MPDAAPSAPTNDPSDSAGGNIAPGEKDTTRRLLIFFALVYLVEGLGQIVGLISQPLTYFLKQVHGWTPVQVTAFITLFNLPWIIKPVYGLISDFVPLFGYRRKSYLVIANVAATTGYCWVTLLAAPSDLVIALMLTAYAHGHIEHLGLLTQEAVGACVDAGVRERAPERQHSYIAFVDPSGGSSDAMTLAIAHKEAETTVLDVIREHRPPFSPEAVVAEYASVVRRYRCSQCFGDRYAGEWVAEQFRKHGVHY